MNNKLFDLGSLMVPDPLKALQDFGFDVTEDEMNSHIGPKLADEVQYLYLLQVSSESAMILGHLVQIYESMRNDTSTKIQTLLDQYRLEKKMKGWVNEPH